MAAGAALHRPAEPAVHPAAGIPGAGAAHAPPHRHGHHHLQVKVTFFTIWKQKSFLKHEVSFKHNLTT